MAEAKIEAMITGLGALLARPGYTPGAVVDLADNDGAKVVADLARGFGASDAWQELGGAREQQCFDMKMLALTDPAKYATARSAALAIVKTATEVAFNTAYRQFHEAGYSREESKTMALRAASVTKGVQEQAMAKKFGGNDSLFMGASAREHAPTHVARTAKPKTARRRRKTRA